jgi:hypothetical protein
MLTKTIKRFPALFRARTILPVGAAIALATVGVAHASASPAPAETQDVARLVGKWKGTASMTMGSDKSDGLKVTWSCLPTSSRWGVRCDAVIVGLPGMDRYEETDLFGYDPGGGKLHWFSVTNAGETHDHVGGRWTGQSAQFVYTGMQEGKPFKEVVDLTFKDKTASALEVHAQTFIDGKVASVLHVDARK